jgi:ribonuclease P protein component
VLARANRVKTPDDFRQIMRRGRRSGGTLLVTHALRTEGEPVRFGFVVGRSVGNAVIRNRVKRRLRAVAFGLLPSVMPGTDVVVRALPLAASGTSAELDAGVRDGLQRSGVLT